MEGEVQKVSKHIKIIFCISITFGVFYILYSLYFFYFDMFAVGLSLIIIGSIFTVLSIGIFRKNKVSAIIALALVSIFCLNDLLSHNVFPFVIELLLVCLYIMAVKQISIYRKLISNDTLEQSERLEASSKE